MRIITCTLYDHDLWLLALAGLVCIAGSLVTIRLWRGALSSPQQSRLHLLFLAAMTSGSAIWATHFIAMLGYRAGVPVTFEPLLTALSIVLAFVGTAAAFTITAMTERRFASIFGGLTLGVAIFGMHYTGMFAFRPDGIVTWSPAYVATSLLLSVALSIAACFAIRLWSEGLHRHIAVTALVGAILSLHFTGMAAIEVTPLPGYSGTADNEASVVMGLSIALVAIIVIGTNLISHIVHGRSKTASDQQLLHIAMHDALTGLANRRRLGSELAKRFSELATGTPGFVLLIFDLDGFKPVNDSFGHPVGDQVLKRVAQRVRRAIRSQDILARIGGDEFAVLCPIAAADPKIGELIASRIVELIGRPFLVEGAVIDIGASVGVAVAPCDGADANTIMQSADIALYTAKMSGRRRYACFTAEMSHDIQQRRALENDLRRAVAKQDFTVAYQPQTDAATGEYIGAEALLRWRHPDRGYVPPSTFIPLAEELGLIGSIGDWILEQACRDAIMWPASIKLAVNLSPVQLKDPRLPDIVKKCLDASGLPPERLELEVTETALIGNDELALQILQRLRALGVAISLDDFGTGYSSLSYLHRFPLNRIKIDRSFVQKIPDDNGSISIVRAVAQLGKNLGLQVTAEGIETDAQKRIITDVGCDNLQGYLISKPISDAEIQQLFKSQAKSMEAA